MKKLFFWLFPPLLFLGLLILALEIIVRQGGVPSYLLPAPSQVLQAVIDNESDLIPAFAGTLRATAEGFSSALFWGKAWR